jgi:hypothetical protein
VCVPSQFKSPNIEDDLEFEWLLCLASTLHASRRLQPTEAGEGKRTQEFPRTQNRKFFKNEGKKVINPTGEGK